MLKTIGKSGQISLGKEYAGRHALVEELEPGVWMIKLGEFIPDSERWLWEQKSQHSLDQALDWAKQHPASASDLQALASRLENAGNPQD